MEDCSKDFLNLDHVIRIVKTILFRFNIVDAGKFEHDSRDFLMLPVCISIILLIILFEFHNVYAASPIFTFGMSGSGPGQFNNPQGIAIDNSGNIYVADNGNHRIDKFSSSGKFLSSFATDIIPAGITINNAGDIFVVDRNSTAIVKFSTNGTLESSFGSAEAGLEQFTNPEDIAVDNVDNIYVTDGNIIQKFNSTGSFISDFFANNTKNCCMNALGIAIDGSNKIYVTDILYHRMIEFNSTGSVLSIFNLMSSSPQFSSSPQGIAVDIGDNIYVADTSNGRILKVNATGHSVSAVEIAGTPIGIAVKNGKVYATDLSNDRVDVFLTSQFVNGSGLNFTSTQKDEALTDQNSTVLNAAVKIAESSPQFQSLVRGYNYTYDSDFEVSGPLSHGGIGLRDHGFVFYLYAGPVKVGSTVKIVEVFEDPTLTKVLNVTSYYAHNTGLLSPVTHQNPSQVLPVNHTVVSPLLQFKEGVKATNVKCTLGFELVIKEDDSSPACVTSNGANILIERGWGHLP